MSIAQSRTAADAVLQELASLKAHDVKWDEGRVFGLAFIADETGRKLAEDAHRMFMFDNGLDPMLFPSLLQMEKDVVAFAVEHLGGDEQTVGSFTSGGTESVLLAVKTARDWARAHRPEVTKPKMIVPITVHPAFHKAASYFDVEAVIVPVDPQTCKADVAAMRAAIDDQTILLVASAPSYAHGAIDPIEAIAALAREHELLCHVDGCIGGFVLPFLRELGHPVPKFDFSVPGVTSMSMDFHKYAYAPKGASVVLYRNPELRRHQLFAHSEWTGYTLVNPTMQSSKSGGPLAGTWALLRHYGREGYREIAGTLLAATKRLIEGINAIDGLYVMGDPGMTLIGVGTKDLSLFDVCDALTARNWHVHPQLGQGDVPPSFHLTVMPTHVPQVEAFLADLAAAVAEVRQAPAKPNELLAMLGELDLAQFSDDQLGELLQSLGVIGAAGGPMAEINQILDSLPPAVTDRLVKIFYDLLSRPTSQQALVAH